jgi:hypothetical protein
VDILSGESGMLGQDVFGSHAVREHRQHGSDREAQPSDAGQAAHDSGVGSDAFVGHYTMLTAAAIWSTRRRPEEASAAAADSVRDPPFGTARDFLALARLCAQIGTISSRQGHGDDSIERIGRLLMGIVVENAVLRGTRRNPLCLGNRMLVWPRAYLTGCTADHGVSRLPGTTAFDGARNGARSEVRTSGVAHLRTRLPPDTTLPIGWMAVGDQRRCFCLHDHERIWAV